MKQIFRNFQIVALSLFIVSLFACIDDPSCSDGEQNQFETGIDCGGPCPACVPPTLTDLPDCTDGMQNGQETGVDCGGPTCDPCPACDDGVQNGEETGIDCGGPVCDPC